MKRTCAVIAAVLVFAAAGAWAAEDIPEGVKTLIKQKCAVCHTGQRPPKGLSLIPGKIASAINAPSAEVPTLSIIDTANPEASYMLKKILRAGDIVGKKMPLGRTLKEADLETLKAWILGLKAK